jgi:hypothetical protein
MPEPSEADLKELETALRSLQPRADLDLAALWFRAGRASAPRGWGWPLAAGASAALAAVLGLLLMRPDPPAVERVVYVPVREPAPAVRPERQPEPEPPSPPRDPGTPPAVAEVPEGSLSPDALRLREHVLRWGFDGLPMPREPAPAAPADTPASLLRAP